jgi:hypothetical protein
MFAASYPKGGISSVFPLPCGGMKGASRGRTSGCIVPLANGPNYGFTLKLKQVNGKVVKMSGEYILVDKVAVPVSAIEWAAWMEGAGAKVKIVKQEVVGRYWVSTVFLGLDHSFGKGGPILFETMIFGRHRNMHSTPEFEDGEYQTRCSTWEQAEAMHQEAVKYAREKSEEMKQKRRGFLKNRAKLTKEQKNEVEQIVLEEIGKTGG